MAAGRTSAGLLPVRRSGPGLQVFLVHPGGPFWAGRDHGAWSIPKGEVGEGEDPLDAARREFTEETGFEAAGPFVALGKVVQKGGKTVLAWACPAELDPAAVASGTFTLEWPPRSGRTATFPEVDRAAWFPLEEARARILEGQRPLLDALVREADAGRI